MRDTFKKMFPDSKIAANFGLGRSSASYVIGEGLAPCFETVIIDDVKKSIYSFTTHFDGTTTVQVKMQMDMTLNYWSPTHNKVWVAYYTSCSRSKSGIEDVQSNEVWWHSI